jgi:NADH dehydrogenase [ubiquinone] 1 alpha subcomplex assembly factor 7
MNALGKRIAALIAAEGPLSVAQFMSICQFDSQGGSYAARASIGRDFITAPEISQTFGELCGLFLAQCWLDQGSPARPRLAELGPGRGTLMSDALRAIAAAAPQFLEGAEVALVEASPILEAAQREKLKAYAGIAWHDRFGEALTDRPLFLIANEFFDCLPMHQYVKTQRGWCERQVTVKDGALAFGLNPVPEPAGREGAPDGGVYEVSPAASALAGEIGRAIAAQGGSALFLDYGYDRAGFGETLQAIAKGCPVEVLASPGEADLSAHVDFPALAAAAQAGGATVHGPVSQCNFLAALGIGPRAERLMTANPEQARAIAAAVDRLVNPAGMGSLFKALALTPPDYTPPGFRPC